MRLLLRGLWWRRGLTLAVFAVAVITTTTAALGPLYARASAESILQDHLSSAGPGAGLALRTDLDIGRPAAYRQALREVPRPGQLHGFPRLIEGFTEPAGIGASISHPPVSLGTSLTWRAGECHYLIIVRGHCPDRPNEVLASQRTIATGDYHWHLGTRLELGSLTTTDEPAGEPSPDTPPARIVGIYRPRNPNATFWFGGDYFAAHLGNAGTPDVVDALFAARSEFTTRLPGSYVEADFDYPLHRNAVRLDDVAAVRAKVRSIVARDTLTAPIHGSSNLPKVFAQAAGERHQVDVGTLLVTLQLAVLAWLVLFQVVSDALEARGNEIAMAKLRGHGPLRTARFGLAEPLILLLAAIPVGIAAALGVTHLFAASALVPGIPVVLTWAALWTALVAFGGGAVAAALAGYRILTRSVLEQWRRTDRRPGHGRLLLAVDVGLAAGAVAAFIALSRTPHAHGSHDTLALLAPALLVFAVATIGVRLLPPVARRIADAARATRRIGTFLAARQVSRRQVGLRLATLLAVAVGLATFGVAGETVASANRVARADAEVGAPRVLSVDFDPGLDPVQATHRADPRGRWAMAAATWLPEGGDSLDGRFLGVDSSRLAAVGLPVSGGLTARRLAEIVGSAPVGPIDVRSSRMRVLLTAEDLRGDRRPDVQLDFRTPRNPFLHAEGTAVRDGAHTYPVAVSCRGGCLLRSITWDRPILAENTLAGTITLRGLDVFEQGRWRSLPIGLDHPRSWYRLTPEGQATDHVHVSHFGVRDQFTSSNGGYGGIAYAADPTPVPIVATPSAEIIGSIVPNPRRVIDETQTVLPISIKKTVPVLPEVTGYGVVADIRYVNDELPDFADEASWQVWVGPRAPPDYRELLTRSGLQITSQRDVTTRVHQLARQAPALALLLLLACALAGAVLAVGGTAISVSASSRRRSYELASLRVVGVSRRSLLRASTLEQLLLLGTATLLGVPTGLIAARLTMPIIPQFADRTPIRLHDAPHLGPTLGFAGAFVVLLVITALVAARALVRVSVPSRLRESE